MIATIVNDTAYTHLVPSWAIVTGAIWFVAVFALMMRLTAGRKAQPR